MLLLEEILHNKSQLEDIFKSEKDKFYKSIQDDNYNVNINKKIQSYILLIKLYNENYNLIKNNLIKMHLDINNYSTYKKGIDLIALPERKFNISDINNTENLEVILKTINSDILELNFEPDPSFEYFVQKKINKSIEYINICILNNNDYISIIDNLKINTIDYSDIQNKIIDRMVNIKSKLKSIDNILVNYNTA
tara:strand:+ start:558 stop:1139 length:582 start_codon:yes stop_codon:yes gene_type:complete